MFLLLIELDDAVADEDIEELKENEKKRLELQRLCDSRR